MLNEDALFRDLEEIGLATWKDALAPLLADRFADESHGDLAKWKDIVRQLPVATKKTTATLGDTVVLSGDAITAAEVDRIRTLLEGLIPWRKGPFNIHGIELDSEWQSDKKWNRICHSIEPLADRNILDVGCGNGYYALRMQDAGAARVIGIDPTVLFVCQFLALKRMSGIHSIHVMPVRLHELPVASKSFDTTFSMGVLYHQRDPADHLAQLRDTLRPGGELVLETLVVPGTEATVLQPEIRYARMRNVWQLPTLPALEAWLREAGMQNIRVADVSATTVSEQRTTRWMPFESLAQALDESDPSFTVEGLPAPLRAVLTCNAH